MLDFYQLTPNEFEDMCYEYVCKLYNNKINYQVKHTRYVHDGGRDIEVTFYDQLTSFKIWAECKQHKRNIGLDDIGKNVVLIISKNIQEVIFFSASEITEKAQVEITNISEKLNFKVSFINGNRLSKAIEFYPDLVKKYFNIDILSNCSQIPQDITISYYVSEYESDIIPINQQKSIFLRTGELFNIYIHLSNQTKKLAQNISVTLLNSNDSIKFIGSTSFTYDFLNYQSDVISNFKGKIINKQNSIIELPVIIIKYKFENNDQQQNTILTLPSLNISRCKQYPLIGKSVTEFLGNKVSKALELFGRNYSVFFDIRGVSGSGKTRLATEICNRALENKAKPIYLNSTDFIEYDIVRNLFCEILHIPFNKGRIDFTKQDICKMIESQGGKKEYSNVIASFMQKGVWAKKESLYIVEALAYFLQHPYHENGYCVCIDNTQALHPEILKLLIRLVEILSESQYSVAFIFISNTERHAVSPQSFKSFLKYLDDRYQNNCNTIISHTCTAFSEEDAKLLLIHLFNFPSQNDVLLNKLLQKTSRLPFEMIMTLEFLSDKNIIEWSSAKEWLINNHEAFNKFIKNGYSRNRSILTDRISAWKETHSKSDYAKFMDILSTVTAFDGALPYTYILDNSMDTELIEQLISSLWLAPGSSEREISFYHDNIKDYCKSMQIFKYNFKVLRKVVKWIDNNPDIEIYNSQKIKFFCYYNLGMTSKALDWGLDILCGSSSLSHTDIVEISRVLYEDEQVKSNAEYYIKIAAVYANAVFSLDNKEIGCTIYQNIIDFFQEKKPNISTAELCPIIHKAINSQLQSARYDTAIKWIDLLKSTPNLPLEYKFIAENRYGVTYIALGQFDKAEAKLKNSLMIASEEMKSLYWSSTAHSDIALYYFYNWRAKGHIETASLIANQFNLAIKDYESCKDHDISRDLEMTWHKVFLDILEEHYDLAITDANNCIFQSKRNNHSYELSRGYNLSALAHLFNNDCKTAQDILQEGLHACTLYGFPSGIFRIYNNLGVTFYLDNNLEKAKYYFELALQTLDAHIEYKQYPVLTNLLRISLSLKDGKLTKHIQTRCNKINSAELFEYCQSMYQKSNDLQQIECFSFWGFKGYSYIF